MREQGRKARGFPQIRRQSRCLPNFAAALSGASTSIPSRVKLSTQGVVALTPPRGVSAT